MMKTMNRRPFTAWRRALLAVAALAAAAPALQAADPAPRKGNILSISGGKPTGKLLTRDQLRGCLKQQAALKEQGADAAKAQAALDADKAEIARLDGEIARSEGAVAAERATVDVTNEAAVTAFNAKLQQQAAQREERDKRVEGYNAKLAPFNGQAQALNTAEQAWKTDCADRAYDEADFFAIQRGK